MADTHADVLDSIVQPEIKEFIETAIEIIPKMTHIMKVMSKMYDVAEVLAKDSELMELLKLDGNPSLDPLDDTIEGSVELVHEAQERAEADKSKVGMIGLYKMLKDPTVQRNLRFMKAVLAEIGERRENSQVH